jgi:hypothetical protein
MDQARDVTATFNGLPAISWWRRPTRELSSGRDGVATRSPSRTRATTRPTEPSRSPTRAADRAHRHRTRRHRLDLQPRNAELQPQRRAQQPAARNPAITVDVDVAADAPASVTNHAYVSGGETWTNNEQLRRTIRRTVSRSGRSPSRSPLRLGRRRQGRDLRLRLVERRLHRHLHRRNPRHAHRDAGLGLHLTGWGGACSGTNTRCQGRMDQARNVTATFTVIPARSRLDGEQDAHRQFRPGRHRLVQPRCLEQRRQPDERLRSR